MSTQWRGQATVLVVDDDPAIRALVADGLEALGFRVLTAAVRSALATVRANPPDVVVLDDRAEGADDSGVAIALRAHPSTAGLPILATSRRNGAAAPGQRSSVDEYLPKPFDLERLCDTVARWTCIAS